MSVWSTRLLASCSAVTCCSALRDGQHAMQALKNSSFCALLPFITLGLFTVAFPLANQSPAMDGGDSHHHHHDMDGGDGGMAPMPMYFINTWRTILWFQSWETKSKTAYAVSIAGLVLLGILHEVLNAYRAFYLAGPGAEAGGVLQEPLVGVANPRVHRPRNGHNERLVASALYAMNVVTGYLLMLAVMTFNVGYFVAVIVGMGIGYYLLFDKVAHPCALTRGDSCHPRHDLPRA